MKKIYSNKYFLDVFHNEGKRYIILKWKLFRIPLEEIKNMHEQILSYALENSCEIFIADTAEASSMLSEEIISWWRDVWIREMIRKGIKMIITILPRDILAQQSTSEWQNAGDGKMLMLNVFTLEQAESKVREFYER